jgi:hypothetical protein
MVVSRVVGQLLSLQENQRRKTVHQRREINASGRLKKKSGSIICIAKPRPMNKL